jgi:hypothetical protein
MSDRSVAVKLTLETSRYIAEAHRAEGATDKLTTKVAGLDVASRKAAVSSDRLGDGLRRANSEASQTSSSIDRLSGRMRLLAVGLGAVGPAAVPIGAAVVPVLASMTSALGATVLGAGAVVTAFQGVGDALDAVNKAQIDPTVENVNKAHEAMNALPEAARHAVHAMSELRPALFQLRDAAASGFFPGFTEGLRDLQHLGPQAERILYSVADATGDLFAAGAQDLASSNWARFFSFVEHEARPTLLEFGQTVGNVAHGLAGLIMAGDPLADDFAAGLLKASRAFDTWANSLTQTAGYREFIDYVHDTGPQIVSTVGSMADALLQVGEAAAPLGGPVLHALEAVADTVAVIADSPIGPVLATAVTSMSALSLASKGLERVGASGVLARFSTDVDRANKAMTVARPTMRDFGRVLVFGGQSAEQLSKQMQSSSGAIAAHSREVAKSKLHVNSWVSANKGMLAGAAGVGVLYAANAAGLNTTYTVLGAMAGSVLPGIGTAAGAAAGAMLDLGSAVGRANAQAADFEKAITSGDVTQITQALEMKRKQVEDYDGLSLEHVWDIFTSGSAGRQQLLREEGDAERALGDATTQAARAQGYASEATQRRTESLRGLHDAMLAELSAELGWKQAMLTATETVGENGHVVDANGNALRGHRQAALDSERAVLGLIAAWNEQVRTGDATAGQLGQTRAAVRRMAAAMGLGEAETRRLIRALDGIPPVKRTKVEVATEQARSTINAFKVFYDSIQSKTVTITTQYSTGRGATSDLLLGPLQHGKKANGGTVVSLANANRAELGATVPDDGGPYADRYPYLLAPKEEVVSNRYGQADEFRPVLKAINAGMSRDQVRGMLADGGTVLGLAGGGTASRRDTDGIHELGKAARESAKQMREAAKAEKERITSLKQTLVSTVGDKFRSNPFEAPSNPWAAGGDWRSTFNTDISSANRFVKDTKRLKKNGLTGGALDYLLTNADAAQVHGFAGMSKEQLATYSRRFAARERAAGAAGKTAGNAAYGAQLATLEREIKGLRRDVQKNAEDTGKAVGDAVNGAARNGARRGTR